MNGKRYIAIVTGILIAIVLGALWLVSPQSQTADTVVSPEDSSPVVKNTDVRNLTQIDHGKEDVILVRKNDGVYELNIVTKKLKPHVSPIDDINTFAGLPKETENEQTSVFMTRALLSEDKTKAIVVFSTFDETKEPSGFDGSLPVLKADEFMCDIALKKCSPTDLFASAYTAVSLGDGIGTWFEYPRVRWYRWDSEKNLLYGHLNALGVGTVSPVYIFNVSNESLQWTIGYNSLAEKEKRAEVPNGAFSPSLHKFVMFYDSTPLGNDGSPSDLVLYDSSDLSKPAKIFDSSARRNEACAVSRADSVAWSADEKMLILAADNQICTLNLESGELSLKYTDTVAGSGIWFDSYAVNLSPSGRYIVFVDYVKKTTSSTEDTLERVLKAIDLNDNSVIELLRNEFVTLNYQI
jgi:hypothetical protein